MTRSQKILGGFFIVTAIPSGMAFSGLSKINDNIDKSVNTPSITETQKSVTMHINTNKGILVIEIQNDILLKSYIKNFLSLSREKYYNGQSSLIKENLYLEFGDPYSKYQNKMEDWGIGGPGYKYPPNEQIQVIQGDYDVALVPLSDGNLHGGMLRVYGKQRHIESIYKLGTLIEGRSILDNLLDNEERLIINSVSMQ